MPNLKPTASSQAVAALSAKRSPDREEIARLVRAVAEAHACEISQLSGDDYPGPRVIQVRIKAPGGLWLTVELNGNGRAPDVHVLSWHLDTQVDTQLDPAVFGESVNKYHFHKATDVAHGTVALLQALELRLTQTQDGSAYRKPMKKLAPFMA